MPYKKRTVSEPSRKREPSHGRVEGACPGDHRVGHSPSHAASSRRGRHQTLCQPSIPTARSKKRVKELLRHRRQQRQCWRKSATRPATDDARRHTTRNQNPRRGAPALAASTMLTIRSRSRLRKDDDPVQIARCPILRLYDRRGCRVKIAEELVLPGFQGADMNRSARRQRHFR